jgi:hypothetical protein
MAEQQSTNYRKVALAGLSSGRMDAVERARDPSSRSVHLREGRQSLEATGDRAALRMFEFAWALAFGRARMAAGPDSARETEGPSSAQP